MLSGSPFVPQGTDVTGTFTATDDHLAGFSLGVLPAGFPNAPAPAGGTAPAYGSPFTLSTTGAAPGGYVLQLVVTDRAIVNSGHIGQQTADHVGFCVEQP